MEFDIRLTMNNKDKLTFVKSTFGDANNVMEVRKFLNSCSGFISIDEHLINLINISYIEIRKSHE